MEKKKKEKKMGMKLETAREGGEICGGGGEKERGRAREREREGRGDESGLR